uniref:Anaphase-promoting complex subunit 4 WD40 domain-containing protein n=1 Tax=Hyaloperonospora arabidopsidis (strain Emoy2) TaxID=559515 RepID=M4BVA9_HYAAE
MTNLVQQLAKLQLGAAGSRHRPSQRLDEAPNYTVHASSILLQRSAVLRALFSSFYCPAQCVLSLTDSMERSAFDRFLLLTSSTRSDPVFQVSYAHNQNLLLAVDEAGAVGVFNAAAGRTKSCWRAHQNAIFDGIWTRDDAHVVTAAGDLQIRIWDVERVDKSSALRQAQPVLTLRGHDMSVKCVREAPYSTHVFVSGGRDGRVLLWDTRASEKHVLSLENVHAEPTRSQTPSLNGKFLASRQQKRRRVAAAALTKASPRSVTCVEFNATGNEIITAGAVDAVVKFWDIRRLGSGSSAYGGRKVLSGSSLPVREVSCASHNDSRRGISSLVLGPRGDASKLLVNVLHDSIALIDIGQKPPSGGCFDARTILRCSGHQSTSFYSKVTFSPDGDFIASASADGVVYVWDAHVHSSIDRVGVSTWADRGIRVRAPCFALKGHADEVNGVTWSPFDISQLASCSDDGTVRCWQIGCKSEQGISYRQQGQSEDAASFELNLMYADELSGASGKAKWANWNVFVQQPDGSAYRVRALKRPLSLKRLKASSQRSLPQVTPQSTERQLYFIDETPSAQRQSQLELRDCQQSQEDRPRGTQSLFSHPKRAQQTLVELWGQ